MSDPITEAIGGLRADIGALRTETQGAITSLRTDLSGRLDTAITRREHEAEVRRIDSEHSGLAARHEDLVRTSQLEHARLSELVVSDQQARAEERARAAAERKRDRQTYLGLTITAIATASGVVGVISSVIAR